MGVEDGNQTVKIENPVLKSSKKQVFGLDYINRRCGYGQGLLVVEPGIHFELVKLMIVA